MTNRDTFIVMNIHFHSAKEPGNGSFSSTWVIWCCAIPMLITAIGMWTCHSLWTAVNWWELTIPVFFVSQNAHVKNYSNLQFMNTFDWQKLENYIINGSKYNKFKRYLDLLGNQYYLVSDYSSVTVLLLPVDRAFAVTDAFKKADEINCRGWRCIYWQLTLNG